MLYIYMGALVVLSIGIIYYIVTDICDRIQEKKTHTNYNKT